MVNAKKMGWRIACCGIVLLGTTSCATNPQDKNDPYEKFNRGVFKFNKGVDKVVIKPVATVYRTITPAPVRQGVTNFFSNIGDVNIAINDALSFKIQDSLIDVGRIMLNSTVGLAGFLDVASEAGLTKHNADFGLTLARWGVRSSEYLVVPFFGPKTVRDALGIPVDYLASPWPYIEPRKTRYGLYAANVISDRSNLIPKEGLMDAAAFDEYTFVKNAYLQNRNYLIQGETATAEAADATPSDAGSAEPTASDSGSPKPTADKQKQ